MIELKDGAIFIADSHYNKNRTELYDVLSKFLTKKHIQIFLMGDIFDFLSYDSKYFISINQDLINLLNRLSQIHQIIYLEGNHDFNLTNLFPDIIVIKRSSQPFILKSKSQTISLAHGDIFTPFGYEVFTYILRSFIFIKFINFIDIKNFISKYVEKKLIKKYICRKQDGFEKFIQKRVKYYKTDLVIEGHFHQGYMSNKYINIPSFACSGKYLIYQDKKFSVI